MRSVINRRNPERGWFFVIVKKFNIPLIVENRKKYYFCPKFKYIQHYEEIFIEPFDIGYACRVW